MSLLRVDSSIRVDGSVSRKLADTVEESWKQAQPDSVTTHRNLALDPIPATAWADSVTGSAIDAAERTEAQQAAIELAATLVDELIAADAVILASPLYNYGVSQHVKTWIDLLLTDPRLKGAAVPPLGGKPMVITVARGGGYGPGTPREGWDHATGYLTRIFGDALSMKVEVVAAELTLAEANPAMAELRDIAKASLATGLEHAATTGRAIGEKVRTAA